VFVFAIDMNAFGDALTEPANDIRNR